MLVCYEFHSRISNEEEDLMFVIEPWMFLVGTIFVPKLVKLEQHVNLISSSSLNLVQHVFVPIKWIYVLHVKIIILFTTFKQHLPKICFQHEVGEMEIDEMPTWIRVQNLCIACWTITKEEQLTKINLCFEKTCNKLRSTLIWNLLSIIN